MSPSIVKLSKTVSKRVFKYTRSNSCLRLKIQQKFFQLEQNYQHFVFDVVSFVTFRTKSVQIGHVVEAGLCQK